MTLFDTSTLAHDSDFRERIAAAAAAEGVTDPHPQYLRQRITRPNGGVDRLVEIAGSYPTSDPIPTSLPGTLITPAP